MVNNATNPSQITFCGNNKARLKKRADLSIDGAASIAKPVLEKGCVVVIETTATVAQVPLTALVGHYIAPAAAEQIVPLAIKSVKGSAIASVPSTTATSVNSTAWSAKKSAHGGIETVVFVNRSANQATDEK